MTAPRRPSPRLTPEHLLLLGVLLAFTAGALWVGAPARSGSPRHPSARAALLPNIGLPVFNGLLPR